jgi:hypothetical protein
VVPERVLETLEGSSEVDGIAKWFELGPARRKRLREVASWWQQVRDQLFTHGPSGPSTGQLDYRLGPACTPPQLAASAGATYGRGTAGEALALLALHLEQGGGLIGVPAVEAEAKVSAARAHLREIEEAAQACEALGGDPVVAP